MHKSQSLLYLTIDLHVSGVTITHLQGHKTTVTTESGNRYGAHTRTNLDRESGWARVPMSQTRPCVECHEPESTHACAVKYTRAWLPSQAPRGGFASHTRTCMGTFLHRTIVCCYRGRVETGLSKPPTTHSHRFQLLHDSSRQQYGVTVTRFCSYSCFVLLKMGDSDARNM